MNRTVEVRFKPSLIGTVADGSITDIKIAADADIDQSKIASLTSDLADKVSGNGTTGNKKVLKLGWDSETEEIVVDREA